MVSPFRVTSGLVATSFSYRASFSAYPTLAGFALFMRVVLIAPPFAEGYRNSLGPSVTIECEGNGGIASLSPTGGTNTMATRKTTRPRTTKTAAADDSNSRTSSSVDEMLLAALERGDDSFQTGRYLATFKEGAMDAGAKPFAAAQGMRVADARDFANQAVAMENVADADAVVFPAIGVALIGGGAARARGMTAAAEVPTDSNIASIDPEYFVFSDGVADAFFRTLDAGTG